MTYGTIGQVDADDLLAALDPEQRAVALARRGPVCVLAGAGTGKTRAITHRIAYAVATGVVNPAHVLALTFTVRAAGELRGRLRALGGGAEAVRATTFHAAALRQLTYFWPRVIGGRAAAARRVEAAAAAGGRRGTWGCAGRRRALRGGDRDRVGEGLPGPPGLVRVRGDGGRPGARRPASRTPGGCTRPTRRCAGTGS